MRPPQLTFLLGLLALAAPLQAQDTQAGPRQGAEAGRVARVRGKGLLKLPGADWDPLSEDAVLRVGDRVRAKTGTLELVVNRDPKRRAGASRYAGERLILGSGAEVGVAPLVSAAPVDLELLGGKAFALGVERLVLKAGLARVELSAGETLRLSPRGVPTRSKTRPRRPKFVSAHESLAAVKQLLYLETFRRWERDARQALVLVPSDPKASPYLARWLTRGPSQLDAKEGVVRGLPGPVDQGLEEQLLAKGVAPMEVRLGRPTDQGGLFSLQAGVRIRVTYRLSGQSELLLRPRLIDPAQTNREDPPPPPDIRAPGRAGLWTQVEFRLDAIEGASAGQVLNYLSFIAGEEGAKGYVLEVKRIVAYVPEPGR